MVEYEPTSQPGINHPPSPDNSQNSGGTPAEQPAVTDKEPQIIDKTITKNENQEPIPEISRNPETSQETPTQNSPKTPENNTENYAQETQKNSQHER